VLHEIIRTNGFGTLVTADEGEPFATHLPFLLEPDGGEHGTLLGHVARGNPQSRQLARGGEEVLAVFQGPHAYVTPSWYRDPRNVPTWNYVAVHAYGRPRILPGAELVSLLRRLAETNEAGFAKPWTLDLLPQATLDQLAGEVVGFAIAVTRLEGKLKLSQNREASDRVRVAAQLAESADPLSQATAAWMRRSASSRG